MSKPANKTSILDNLTSIGIALLVLTMSGCASYQKNLPLPQYQPDKGYRYQVLEEESRENTDSLFVVVSFSGGGTRAAALSYGILEKLKNTPIEWKGVPKSLLDEVDIISSVSGGSFTSAYYGLNREAIFNGDYENNYLKKDIEHDLFMQLFNPINWFKLLSPDYGRSDLVNEYYQQHMFGQKTFADLQQNGKPFLMINGTDMTTGGQFPFIQDQFDLICSDLSSYPVSRAVATSSAFPGLLTPLTYNNYAGSCNYNEPTWVKNGALSGAFNPELVQFVDDQRSYYLTHPQTGKRDYVHMMDGGVADNIGMRSLTFGLQNTGPSYSILRRINNAEIEKLVVIVVNAATDPANGLDKTASVPGLLTTVISSATVPLDNYTFDTINRAEGAIDLFKKDIARVEACNRILKNKCPAVQPLPAPGGIDSYVSVVTFNSIGDPEERYWYKNLPTNFDLPAETVDKLMAKGKELLSKAEGYKQLLRDIGKGAGSN
ncbi:MAG: patatin-like phospholipase family protein [Gammaproteobacteria bacterium]|nr:patatin-like phospholipase family protein [Gammaproteobacteria bacterium]